MANSIGDLLMQKDFDEPAEMRAIKNYVQKLYQTDVEILLRDQEIVIITESAPLAATLRMQVRQLQAAAKTKRKIRLRIR